MTDPRIDAQLREFLGNWQHDQAQGHTIANLRMEIHQLTLKLEEVANENKLLRLRVERHGQRILAIEQKLEMVEPEEMNTGQHQIEDLKRLLAQREREIEKRDEEGKWWRRTGIRYFVAAVAWMVTAAIGVVLTLLLGRKS